MRDGFSGAHQGRRSASELDPIDANAWARLERELPLGWEPLMVQQTPSKRALGEVRFLNAIASLDAIDTEANQVTPMLYYGAGVAAQMGLTAYLLDRGFDDYWCARNIGLRITVALDWANAAGLNHVNPSICQLAEILTPYWKWRRLGNRLPVRDAGGGFKPDHVHTILDNLLDHIRNVAGFETSTANSAGHNQGEW